MQQRNNNPKQKIEQRFPRSLVAMICLWAYIIAYYLLPTSIAVLTDPKAKPYQLETNLIALVSGLFFAGIGVWLSFLLYFHTRSQRQWAGKYYEFNTVQLRVMETIKGEPIFNWQDVADALEVHDAADRQKLFSAMRAKLYIQGDEREPYISKTGLWQLLRQKTGRPAILFKQFLNQHPKFAQHFPPEPPVEAAVD